MAKIEDGQRVRAPWQGSDGVCVAADNRKNAPSPRAVQGQVIRFPSRAIGAVPVRCDEGGWLTLCGAHGWLYDTRRDGPPRLSANRGLPRPDRRRVMKKRRPPHAINSHKQLTGALRHGTNKTCGGQGPYLTILPSGRRCDPAVGREALRRGWLSPVDLGLFGPDTRNPENSSPTQKEHVHD